MDPFRRLALFTVARDGAFVAVAASTLMIGFSFDLPLSLLIGANVALLFCLGLVWRRWLLTDARLVRTEAWRILPSDERPRGSAEREMARAFLGGLLLQAAQSAVLAAIVLSSFALMLSLVGAPPPAHVAKGDPLPVQVSRAPTG